MCLFFLLLTGCEDSHITEIKESLLFDRQDMTWEDLFKNNKICDKPEWNYSKNSKGQEFVQVRCSLAKYAESGALSKHDFFKNYTEAIFENNYEFKTDLYKRYQKAMLEDLEKEYGGYFKQYLDFIKKRSLLIIFKINKNGTYSFYSAMAGHYLDGFLDTDKLLDLNKPKDIVNYYPKDQLVKDERLYKHFSNNKFSSKKESDLFYKQNQIISNLLQVPAIIPLQNCLIQENEDCFVKNLAAPLFKPNDLIDYGIRSQDIFLREFLNSITENLNKKSYVFLLATETEPFQIKPLKLDKIELSKSELRYGIPARKGFPGIDQTIKIKSSNGEEYTSVRRVSLYGTEGNYYNKENFLKDRTGLFRIPFNINQNSSIIMYVSLLPEKTELCTSSKQISDLEYDIIKNQFDLNFSKDERRQFWDKFLEVVNSTLGK